MKTVTRIALAFAVVCGLGGCAGEQLIAAAGSTNAGASANAGVGLAASNAKPAPFNPFNEDQIETTPRREIIEKPNLADVLKTGTLPDMVMGRKDAPVTIVKYASLTCPYCRKFQKEAFPILKRDYIDTGKVRFILREFPIGRQSGLATIAWRCAPAKHFFKLYEKFMFNQRAWVSQQQRPDPILKIASKVGLTRAQFDSCRKNQVMLDGLNWIKDRGRNLGVIGTPNFFINERLVKTRIGITKLRAMIDPLLKADAGTR